MVVLSWVAAVVACLAYGLATVLQKAKHVDIDNMCAIYESATRKPQPRRPPVEASPRCIGDVMPRPWLFTRIAVQVQVGNG